MKINTNMSAIIANKELSSTESALSKSLERLSSGFKLNHSEDDAAGMAISQKMRTQLRGLDRANQNAADGVSVIETAEGALTEIHAMLQRMRELAVSAANDANGVEDRAAIQEEIESLGDEIDRISRDTEFNMQSLIDGNLARRAYTDTNGTEVTYMSENMSAGTYSLTITQDPAQAVAAGGAVNKGAFDGGAPKELAGTITINDIPVTVNEGDTYDDVMSKIQQVCTYTNSTLIGVNSLTTSADNTETAGFDAVAVSSASNLVIFSNAYGDNAEVTIDCDNEDLANALGFKDGTVAAGKDVEATFATKDGERVGFNDAATISTDGREVTVKSAGGFEMKVLINPGVAGTVFDAATGDASGSTAKDVNMDITDLGMMVVHIGANEKQQIVVDIPEVTKRSLNLEDVSVMTHKLASDTITRLDSAIESVSIVRSKIGAYQNRLEYSMGNLDISNENLTAALSRIMDVDMAKEMTEYTQQNVLSQAGISMLSQANARPESVLQLLQ